MSPYPTRRRGPRDFRLRHLLTAALSAASLGFVLLVSAPAPSAGAAPGIHDRAPLVAPAVVSADSLGDPTLVTAAVTGPAAWWNLDRIDEQLLPLDGTYAATGNGAGVDVYVLDTGILASHSEFGGRVTGGFTAVLDGRGSTDCYGSGTRLADVVGGATYGVADGVDLIPVRVFDCRGRTTWARIFAGLDYVVTNHAPSVPAVLLLGVISDPYPDFDTAVQAVVDDGVTVVAAAGDYEEDTCQTSPDHLASVVAVAGTDPEDGRIPWSGWGGCVDLFAPGAVVRSAGIEPVNDVIDLSSTWLSAAHVAGVAAVLLGAHPTWTPAQVQDQIVRDATRGVVDAPFSGEPNRLLFSPPGPAANDTFATSTVLDPATAASTEWMMPVSVTGVSWTSLATAEPGEPNHAGVAGGQSVWWSVTPTVSGSMSARTGFLTVPSVVAVYTGGTVSTLTPISYNSSTVAGGVTVVWNATAGTTYHVAVDRTTALTGSVELVVFPPAPPAPANDHFAAAAALADGVLASNVSATSEANEPMSWNTGGESVWWVFTPLVDATMNVGAMAEGFTPVVTVYTGSSVDGLTPVIDTALPETGVVYRVFTAAAGETYHVRVVGWTGGKGPFELKVRTFSLAAPTAPRSPVASPRAGSVALSWQSPAATNGARVRDYVIQWRAAGAAIWTTFPDGTSTSRSRTVIGLVNGTAYEFRITAVNSVGAGLWSATVDAVAGSPRAPSRPSATAGREQLRVTWSAPSSNGSPILDYALQYRIVGDLAWTLFADGVSTVRSATVTGLVPGATYEVRVGAISAIGQGPWSPASTPDLVPAPPGAPGAVTGSPRAGAVALTWSAPASNGGASIKDYLVQYRVAGSPDWTLFVESVSTSRSRTVTGLVDGTTYEFRVAARNLAGDGPWSDAVIVVSGAPRAPGKPSASSRPGALNVSWSTPSSNGSPIVDYVVQYSVAGSGTWVTFVDALSTTRTLLVTGLTSGVPYVVRVAAVNADGTGPWSVPSSVRTPT